MFKFRRKVVDTFLTSFLIKKLIMNNVFAKLRIENV